MYLLKIHLSLLELEVAMNTGRHTFSPWAMNTGKNNEVDFYISFDKWCRSFLWILYTFIGLALGLGLGLVSDLKMICNDFLVVKVNCWSYVFNIIQSIRILRNIKDKKIAEKKRLKVRTDVLFTFRKLWRHTRKTQPNSLLIFWVLTTDRAKTNRHNDKRRNRLLKHKRVK